MLIIDNLVFWGGGGAKNFQYSTKSHWAPKPLRPFPTLHGKKPVSYSPYFPQSWRQSASCLGAADAHLCDSSTLVLGEIWRDGHLRA